MSFSKIYQAQKSTKNSASVFRGFISWSSSFLTARFVGEIRACNDSCIYCAAATAAAAAAAAADADADADADDDDDDDDDDYDDTVGFFPAKLPFFLGGGQLQRGQYVWIWDFNWNTLGWCMGFSKHTMENPRFSTLVSIFSPSASGTCSPWENPMECAPHDQLWWSSHALTFIISFSSSHDIGWWLFSNFRGQRCSVSLFFEWRLDISGTLTCHFDIIWSSKCLPCLLLRRQYRCTLGWILQFIFGCIVDSCQIWKDRHLNKAFDNHFGVYNIGSGNLWTCRYDQRIICRPPLHEITCGHNLWLWNLGDRHATAIDTTSTWMKVEL